MRHGRAAVRGASQSRIDMMFGYSKLRGAEKWRALMHGMKGCVECICADGFDGMALIGRLFVIFFGFLAACLVAGMIVVVAVLFPQFSDFADGPIDPDALNIVLGFGFIFVSGFALLPAMIVVLITEAFYIRGALTYAAGGAMVGLTCYLGLIPFDPGDAAFRRHRPASS